jgi:two-component system, chemotaxis family, protein-glutamate methylesterase/glutaminase
MLSREAAMADAEKKVGGRRHDSSPRCDRIVIGGSAGSLDTLRAIAHQFPADFPGTIFVVAHIGQSRSTLPDLLARASKLSSSHPPEEEPIRSGHIYVAPPDRHMLVKDDEVCLSRGPREHFTRPAIDPLFRSAALAYGPRVVGVVLSGGGSDGATGLDTIRRAGGLTVVEDPSEAAFPDMPATAASIAHPHFVVRTAEIPAFLLRLSEESAELAGVPQGMPAVMETEKLETPLTFSCPECGGALKPIAHTGGLQYGCHIGHRIGAMELLEAQTEGIEKGINTAIRMLNEQAEFARQMIEGARSAPFDNGLVYWERLLDQAEEQIETLRRFLEQRPVLRPKPVAARGG